MGPSEEAKQLRVALYAVAAEVREPVEGEGERQGDGEEGGMDEFIGSGSMSLAHLEEVQHQHHVRIPIITPAGAHLADLSVDLHFYHTRTPGAGARRQQPPSRLGALPVQLPGTAHVVSPAVQAAVPCSSL